MRFLKTNTAVIVTVGPFYDKTDGVTIENALTITSERITLTADTDAGSAPTIILDNIAGATAATANDLNYITNCDAGLMQMELAAADVNRLGRMMLTITDAANHVPVFHEFMVLPAMIYDALILGTDVLDSSMTQILGTAVSNPATAGILDVNLKNIVNAAVATGTAQLGVNVVTQANIDFGALQKTSLNAATPASVQNIAATGTGFTAIPWNAAWDAEVQSEVNDEIVLQNLDHLCKTATAGVDMTTEVVDGTIISRMISNSDTSLFVPATHSMQIVGADVAAIHVHAQSLIDELAKVPKSDSTVTFNATALASIKTTMEASASLLWKAFSILNNKMNVTDADGTVALRAIGDGSTIATGSVTDNSTTTTRLELTWL